MNLFKEDVESRLKHKSPEKAPKPSLPLRELSGWNPDQLQSHHPSPGLTSPLGPQLLQGVPPGGSQTLHPLACSQVLRLLNSGARTSSDLTWCLRNKASGTRYSACPPLTRVPAREPVSIGKKKRNHKNLGSKVLQQGMAYFKDSTLAKALREERCKAERMWVS